MSNEVEVDGIKLPTPLPKAGEVGFPAVGTPERAALTKLVIQRRSAGLTPCCGATYVGETNRCSSCDGVVAQPIRCNAGAKPKKGRGR